MKVAYFTPVSPQRTGITDYSEKEILPYINKYLDIDIFIDDGIKPTNRFIINNFAIYNYKEYKKIKNNYDIAIYQMGNNSLHEFVYNSLLKNTGITVLHDIYLHGFLMSISLARGDKERYFDEFRYCFGNPGIEIARRALEEGVYPEFEYTLIKRIIDNSIGIFCHSDFGVKKVFEAGTSSSVTKLNQPFTVSEYLKNIKKIDREGLKFNLGIEKKHPIVASFGFISAHKRHPVVLRAFRQFLKSYPDSILLLIGSDLMGIDKLINDLGLARSVIKTGYIPENRLLEYLEVSDFCLNLRYPTAGETSRSVLQLLACEKPVIVSNVGWFCELPNNCCLKVDVDSYEEDTLLEYMKLLASDEGLIKIIGKNARNYVINEHNPEKISLEQYKSITNILNGRENIFDRVSKGLANVGITEDDGEIVRYISEKIRYII